MPASDVTAGIERVAAARSIAAVLAAPAGPRRDRDAPPIRDFVEYSPPRQVYEWVEAGQVKRGHQPNGLALPWDVVETLGLPDPPQYLVVGEERYSDGRWYLAFAVSEAWVRAKRPPCEECGGTGGRHDRVEYEDPATHKLRKVRCPNAPMVRR